MSAIDREEKAWARLMEGKSPAEREAIMAETLQNAKDQFYAMAAARPWLKPRKARKGARP